MEKIKPFLFAGDMILSTNNSKEFFKISRITEFDKVSGYKEDTEKSIAFLFTNSKHVEIKIKTHNAMYNCFLENRTFRYKSNKTSIRCIC